MAKEPRKTIGIALINSRFGKSKGSLPPVNQLAGYIEAILKYAVQGSEKRGDLRMIILRTTDQLYRLTQQGGPWAMVRGCDYP